MAGLRYTSRPLLQLLIITIISEAAVSLRNLRRTREEAELELNDSMCEMQSMRCKASVNRPCHSNENIKFYFYRRGRSIEEFNIKQPYAAENYDPTENLKVLIHGFSSATFIINIVNSYLERGLDSVLVVNWEKLAQKPFYLSAKMNTWEVGRCTAEALSVLRPRGELHIVGFSLGAHVAGHAATVLRKFHGLTVDRITGLDPALPLYATPRDNRKLDRSDAIFVDVIHSNPGLYGKAEPSGHVDFYINGLSIQPGCFNATNPPLCSHRRASEVFAESINSQKGFWGVKCPSIFYYFAGSCRQVRNSRKTLMGENVDPSAKGIYFVPTNNKPPYAVGQNF